MESQTDDVHTQDDMVHTDEVETDLRLDKLPEHANKTRWSTYADEAVANGEFRSQELAMALKHLRNMAVEANKQEVPSKSCVYGEKMLWFPFQRALIAGHIYSEDGLREARISGCCEYHFDKMFDENWIDIITGEPGDMHPDREAWLAEQAAAKGGE